MEKPKEAATKLALDDLQRVITHSHELLSKLDDQLEPVSSAEPLQDTNGATGTATPALGSSQIVTILTNLRQDVANLNRRIEKMTARLEV